MNFKSTILVVGLIFSILSIGSAEACSIHVNQKAKKNALTMEMMNMLNITIDQVNAGNVVQNYQMQILNEDPSTLCPNDIQFSAKITLNYRPSILRVCKNTMTVTMVEHWGTPGSSPTVNFSTVDPVECHNVIIRPHLFNL